MRHADNTVLYIFSNKVHKHWSRYKFLNNVPLTNPADTLFSATPLITINYLCKVGEREGEIWQGQIQYGTVTQHSDERMTRMTAIVHATGNPVK